MTEADAVLDTVAGYSGTACTWDNVIAPLAAMERDAEGRTSSLTFVKNVSADKEVRTAAAAAQAELSAWSVKADMREDVFRAVKQYAGAADLSALDAEGRRFVERTLRDYRRRGLALPPPERARVEALKTRISDIGVAFQQALAEDATKLAFGRAELAGMPDDFVAGLGGSGPGGGGGVFCPRLLRDLRTSSACSDPHACVQRRRPVTQTSSRCDAHSWWLARCL
jgi:Zn-dependent oligopeptidase